MRPTQYRTRGQHTRAAIIGKLYTPQTRRALLDSMRHRPDAVIVLDYLIGAGIVVQIGLGTKSSPYMLQLMPNAVTKL